MPHTAVIPFTAIIRPSRLWLGWVTLTHAALIAALVCLLPIWFWPLLAGCPFTLWLALAPGGWLPGAASIRQIQIDASGRLFAAIGQNGPLQQAEVLDDSFVSAWLVILNLRIAGRRHSAIILNDNTPAEFRRALRVYLRWYPLTPQPAKRRLIGLFKKNESTKHPA